jgi:hypothetical protein
VVKKRECRGRQPFAGARGALAISPFLTAEGGKKRLFNGPEGKALEVKGKPPTAS